MNSPSFSSGVFDPSGADFYACLRILFALLSMKPWRKWASDSQVKLSIQLKIKQMHMRLQLFSDICFKRTSEDSLLECANTGLDRESKMRYQIPFQKIVETWNTPKTMTIYVWINFFKVDKLTKRTKIAPHISRDQMSKTSYIQTKQNERSVL